MQADMVLTNGNILTMNPAQPHAQAVAIRDTKLTEVGTNKQIRRWIGNKTKIIDLKGKTVVPGLIDAHVHMAGFGRWLKQINLRGAKSIREIRRKVKERANETPRGKWILGRGWDQDRLAEKRYPSRWDLDKAAPHHPVVLNRVCGHASVANTKALELAEITKETSPPPGGQIDKDLKTNEPTGILRENAMNLVWDMVPEPSEEERTEACSLACQKAVEAGLTSVHWLVYEPIEIRILQKLKAQGKLPLRAFIVMPIEFFSCLRDAGLSTGFGDQFTRIGSIKILADGSLGARTAALEQPYNDDPSTRGMTIYNQRKLYNLVAEAHRAGFQVAVHAIGDRAVELVLTAFERALKQTPREGHRHRIEHASVLNKKLIQRMKKLGLIASVQPHFIVSDFWVVNRVGKVRARWVYPFKALIREGVVLAGGSDCPVEPISPILGIYAAVARESFPQERVTVEEALRMYTIDAAFASFEEDAKGSIAVGKLADLTVLSEDPRKIAPSQIKDIKVEMTIVGGRVVYKQKRLEKKEGEKFIL